MLRCKRASTVPNKQQVPQVELFTIAGKHMEIDSKNFVTPLPTHGTEQDKIVSATVSTNSHFHK